VVTRSNYANSAMRLLKYDEAEQQLVNAASIGPRPGSISNHWKSLAFLYVLSGRFNEACGAIKKMVQWGLVREPFLDQQCETGEYACKAGFLLECGYPEQAYAMSRRMVNSTTRQGYSSGKKYEALGGALFFHFMAAGDYQELARERLIQKNPAVKARMVWIIQALDCEKALLKPRIRRIILSQSRLDANLIPYHHDGVGIERYYVADLAAVAGKGAMSAELGKIRKTCRYRELLEPYFAELAGELGSRGSGWRSALGELAKARETLPAAEKLLVARSCAVTGRILETRGDLEGALQYYQKAYRIWPGLFRHLKIRLPVSFRAEGQESLEIKKRLAHSPRFRMKEGAFVIYIRALDDRMQGSLLDSMGATLCTMSTARSGRSDLDTDTFLEEFHMKIFSAPVDASLSEINSLDGSNLRDDQVRGALQDILFQK